MDNKGYVEKTLLKDVLGGFISSYTERDRSMEFSYWLEDRLRQEIPDMSAETGRKLAGEIIDAVAAYDKTLNDLNMAVDAGQSKEEWFAGRMAETYAGMSLDTVGEKLQQLEDAVLTSNMQLMHEIGCTQTDGGNSDDSGSIEWNKYSVKQKAYEIGEQVNLTGEAVVANVLKERVQDNEIIAIGDIVGEAFQNDMKKDSGEVKAVVAGAVKAAVEKGLGDFVPKDTPIDVIGSIAGAAVEGAEALFDMAKGESTMLKTMDRIGRAVVVTGCQCAGSFVKGCLSKIPFAGPVIVDLASGLLEHVSGPKFAANVYNTVRDMAVATWEGMKRSRVGKIITSVKNVIFG